MRSWPARWQRRPSLGSMPWSRVMVRQASSVSEQRATRASRRWAACSGRIAFGAEGADDVEFGPGEVAGGFVAVGADEVDADGAGGVVDVDDVADVVAVVGLDGLADLHVAGGALGPFDGGGERSRVDADGVGGESFDAVAGARRGRRSSGRVAFSARWAMRSASGSRVRAMSLAREVSRRSMRSSYGLGRFVTGEREAVVVAGELGVDLGHLGGGDDEEVGVAAAGHLDVGGFAVEAVDADGDGGVPGAALGAVGGDGVAVVDPAGGEVVGVEVQRGAVEVAAHDDAAVGSRVEDGGGVAVADPGDGAVGLGDSLVAAQHDPLAAHEIVPARTRRTRRRARARWPRRGAGGRPS